MLEAANKGASCFCLLTLSACLPRPAPPGPDNCWHFDQVKAMDSSLRKIAGQACTSLVLYSFVDLSSTAPSLSLSAVSFAPFFVRTVAHGCVSVLIFGEHVNVRVL